jgi:diguanylate cyclase (GGDEF)-like protein
MLLAGDFCHECMKDGEIRPAFANVIRMEERGPFRRSAELIQSLSTSYGGNSVTELPAALERIIEILEAAQARSSSRGAWRAFLPEDRAELVPLSRKAAFERDLVQAIAEASPDEPLALIATDIDHFKSVNDTYGHLAGDEVLKAVGAAHELVCRGRGKGYRVGGEELMVLAPNTSSDEALALAERLRRSVEGQVIGAIGGSVTLSAGIAVATHPETTSERLREDADGALYRAKRGGRNRVEMHDAAANSSVATPPSAPTPGTSASPTSAPSDRPEGCPPDIPPDAFATIRKKCEAEWPEDFQMRRYCETKQFEAYRQLYGSSSSRPSLSPEATGLLEAAAQSGELLVLETDQTGKWVRAGAKDFRAESDPAFAARHFDALEWLVATGLARRDRDTLFILTGKGFEMARALHR